MTGGHLLQVVISQEVSTGSLCALGLRMTQDPSRVSGRAGEVCEHLDTGTMAGVASPGRCPVTEDCTPTHYRLESLPVTLGRRWPPRFTGPKPRALCLWTSSAAWVLGCGTARGCNSVGTERSPRDMGSDGTFARGQS